MKRLTFTNKTCRNYLICVYIFIIVTSSTQLLSFRTDKKGLCQMATTKRGYQIFQLLACFLVILGLAVPTIIMTVAYIMTIYYMFVKSSKIKQDIVLRKHRMKIVKSLGVLIAIFLFCWAPFSLNYLISYLGIYAYHNSILFRQVNKLVLLPTTMVATFNALTFALSSRDIRQAAVLSRRKQSNLW